MITDLVAIFRARQNPALATRLAAQMARGQLLDRVSAPLLIAQIVLWALIIVSSLLVIASLYAAVTLHWSLALPGLIPLALGIVAKRVERGLRHGMDQVRQLSERLTDQGLDRLLQREAEANPLSDDPASIATAPEG